METLIKTDLLDPVRTCDLCGSDQAWPISDETCFEGDGLKGKSISGVRTVVCQHCGLVYFQNGWRAEKLRDFYQNDFTRVLKRSYHGKPSAAYIADKDRSAQMRLAFLEPFIQKPLRVLDVRCEAGSALHQLAQRGHDVQGVELFPTTRQVCLDRGLTVAPFCFSDFQIPFTAPFDLILSREFLTHSRSATANLEYLLGLLNVGGYLYVEEPELRGHLKGPLANRLIVVHYQHLQYADLMAYGQKFGLQTAKWAFVWSKKIHRVLYQKTARTELRPVPTNSLHAQLTYRLLQTWRIKDRIMKLR